MNRLIAILLVPFLFLGKAAASDPIRPYGEKGESGLFLYAIYNNQWLQTQEKDIKRIAILGLKPGSKVAEGKLVIPASIDGVTVYGIDENAFKSSEGIKSIAIPKTVRFLKAGTLNKCPGLETIVVAEDHPEFASIDGVMFDKKKTKLLTVGSGRQGHFEVPEGTTEIGPGAFLNCVELERVTIPESVTDIGGHSGYVFQGCTKLVKIEIPNTVTNIGQKSFQDCTSLEEITIPAKVTAIPFGLFWRCNQLITVRLPDGITSVGNYAFADCHELKLNTFPKSLTKVGAYAFKDCRELGELDLPKSVQTLDRGAFKGTEVNVSDHPDGAAAK